MCRTSYTTKEKAFATARISDNGEVIVPPTTLKDIVNIVTTTVQRTREGPPETLITMSFRKMTTEVRDDRLSASSIIRSFLELFPGLDYVTS